MLFYFACEAAGASSARHSLRPLNFRCASRLANSREARGENAEAWVKADWLFEIALQSTTILLGTVILGMRHLAQASDAQLRVGESIIPNCGYGFRARCSASPRNDGSSRCPHGHCAPCNRIVGLHPSSREAVGRVAHRERSERCVGWGLPQGGIFAFACATPTRRFAPPSPRKGEG